VVDVEEAHHKGHLTTAKEVGVNLTLDAALKIIPHFIGGPNSKIVEEIWRLSDRKKSTEFIYNRDKYYYFKFLAALNIKPRAGFVRILKKLRALGYKTCIGSSTVQNEADMLLTKSGLNKIFSRAMIVLREDVANFKPAPDVFLETAKRMGIQPKEQLVFDDSPRGIQSAVAAGSIGIGMPVYDKKIIIRQLTNAGAKAIYQSWRDVDLKTIVIF